MVEFVLSGILSFITDHWMLTLGILVVVGIVIRVAYYASNPIALMTDIGKFIRVYWKEIIVALVIIGAIAKLVNQDLIIKEKDKQLAVAEQNVNTLKQNEARLERAIAGVNSVVARFDTFTAETRTNFAALNKDIGTGNKNLAQQLQHIMKEKKPQTCEEAMAYLIDANKGYAK